MVNKTEQTFWDIYLIEIQSFPRIWRRDYLFVDNSIKQNLYKTVDRLSRDPRIIFCFMELLGSSFNKREHQLESLRGRSEVIYLVIYRSSRCIQAHQKQPEETHSFSIEYFPLKGEKNEAWRDELTNLKSQSFSVVELRWKPPLVTSPSVLAYIVSVRM